jgi:hypothetical protein
MDLSFATPAARSNSFRLFMRTLLVLLILLSCWAGYEFNWVRQRHAYASLQQDKLLAAGFGVEHYADHNKLHRSCPTWLVGESGLAKLPILYPRGQREQEIQRAQRMFPESEIMPLGEQP